ncbi:hypothetical protein [Bacillus sp. 1NLA3E]|uniref:hypothetical protein n=1 Tax=Bacillus sp. 1NLA3E TaxID=666686 RepID=UPI000247F416|nr:hypothetical protein [Bacillus sp. 1NLA3E]
MYRPTVRYDDAFRTYVDDIFRATHLDRYQIIRAALFSAAHSKEFHELLKPYRKGDVPTPSPLWALNQVSYWMEQCPKVKVGGKEVYANTTESTEGKTDNGVVESGRGSEEQSNRRLEPITRQEGAIPIRTEGGGIKIRIG